MGIIGAVRTRKRLHDDVALAIRLDFPDKMAISFTLSFFYKKVVNSSRLNFLKFFAISASKLS